VILDVLCHDLASVLGNEHMYLDRPSISSDTTMDAALLSLYDTELINKVATYITKADSNFNELKTIYSENEQLQFNLTAQTVKIPKENLRLNIFPNPATNEVQINFRLSKPCKGSIHICSLDGKTIETFKQKSDFCSGINFKTLKISHLKPGNYLIYFKIGEIVKCKKLIIN
jgi:hypothetical protein